MEVDVGRPLAHFSNNIDYAALVPDAEEVLRTLVPKQRKVRTVNGQWYLMRIIPYRTGESMIKGVVISFIDIAEIILAGEQVLALAMSVEKSTASIALADAANRIVYVNHRFTDIIGWRADEAIGRDLRLAFGATPDDPAHDGFDRAMAAGTLWTGRLRHDRRDGVIIVEDAVVIPLPGAGGAAGKRLKIGTVVVGATS
jgi:two-component system CheB/CheR fusion protein